jgi:hypothetical protein
MKHTRILILLSVMVILLVPAGFAYAYGGGGNTGVSQPGGASGGDLDSPPAQYQPTTGPITVSEQDGSRLSDTTKPGRPAWSPEYTNLTPRDQQRLNSIFQDLYEGGIQLQHQQAPVEYRTIGVQEGNAFVPKTIAIHHKHPGLVKIERAWLSLASNPQLRNAYQAELNRRQAIDAMDRRDAARQLHANYQRMQDDENAMRVQLIKHGGRALIGNNLGLGLLYSLTWTAAEAPNNLSQRQYSDMIDRTIAIEVGKKVGRTVLFK